MNVLCVLPINRVDKYTLTTITSLSNQRGIRPILYIIGFTLKKEDIKLLKTTLKETNVANKLILFDEDFGPVHGYNIGILEALKDNLDFEYILKMDDDIEFINGDTVKNLINIAKKYQENVIVAPVIFDPEKNKRLYGFRLGHIPILNLNSKKKCITVDLHIGTVLLFKKEIFFKIGPFKGYYFIIGDPSDWMLRARKKGIKCVLSLNDEIIHPTRPKTGVSPKRIYFIIRNRVFLCKENFGMLWLPYFLLTWIGQLKNILDKSARKETSAVYKKRYLNRNLLIYAIKGFIDGLLYRANYSPIKYDFEKLFNYYYRTVILSDKKGKEESYIKSEFGGITR